MVIRRVTALRLWAQSCGAHIQLMGGDYMATIHSRATIDMRARPHKSKRTHTAHSYLAYNREHHIAINRDCCTSPKGKQWCSCWLHTTTPTQLHTVSGHASQHSKLAKRTTTSSGLL